MGNVLDEVRHLFDRNPDGPFCIYALVSPSGKIYVGKAGDFDTRVGEHVRISRGNKKKRFAIHYAIAKYGIDSFTKEVLARFGTEKQALSGESRAISFLRENKHTLYNITDGGEGISGYRHTEETKEKLRKASLGNKHGVGFRWSDDAKKEMSRRRLGNKYRLGIKHDEETKKKISASISGNKNPFWGKKHSAEVLETFRGANNGNARLTKEQAEEIRLRTEESVRDLAKEYGVGDNTVRRILKGETYV